MFSLPVQAQEDENGSADMAPPALFGFMVAQQVGLDDLGFSDEEKALFLEGMEQGLADGSMEDIQDQLPRLQQFLQERAEAAQAEAAEELAASQAEVIEELENDPDVIADPSGFYYEIIESGDDVRANEEDTVLVHYKGSLVDGAIFDSSYDRGQPATFPMGGVIPGFSGGLSKIGQGGEVRIYIPSELGYGQTPPQGSGIPPGAMLVFDAELIAVNPDDGSEAAE